MTLFQNIFEFLIGPTHKELLDSVRFLTEISNLRMAKNYAPKSGFGRFFRRAVKLY